MSLVIYVYFATFNEFIFMASQFEVSTSDADNNSGSKEADLSREVAGWNLGQDTSYPPDWDFSYTYQRLPANSEI